MRSFYLLVLMLISVWSWVGYSLETLDVYFINVGAGDAILIDFGNWEALLDAGRGFPKQNAELLSALSEHVSDGTIELAILSHPHSDHYGGFSAVFHRYQVREFLRSADTNPDSPGTTYSSFLSALGDAGLVPRLVGRGQQFTFGQLEWSVLGPDVLISTPRDKNDNENSLVLLLEYGEVHFLFTGDIEVLGEAALLGIDLPDGPLILKVAHHGSHTSTSLAFLDWASPDLAVISTKYDVPPACSNLVIEGIPFFMTSESGSLCVSTDGTHWSATDAGGSVLTTTTATALPPEGNLFLNIEPVAATGQGSNAMLRASTAAGASCSITVHYKSGPSTAAGLVPEVAGADGHVSWTWRVGPRTTPGTYRIEVLATLGDATISESVKRMVPGARHGKSRMNGKSSAQLAY